MKSDRKKLRVGSYCRVSTLEQTEGYSIEAQIKAMRQWCEIYPDEYEIVTEFRDEGISGKHEDIAKRPGFQAAVEAVKSGQIDAIMVHKFDRAARNLHLFLSVMQDIDGKLVSVMQRADYTDASGKLFVNMLMAFSQYYSDNLSDEVKKGLRVRREKGLPHQLPFGACYPEGENGSKQPPIPDRQVVVTDMRGREWSRYDALVFMFEQAAAGKSLAEITSDLWSIGFTVAKANVAYLISNEFFIGRIPVGDRKGGRNSKRRFVGYVDGAHEPLIDPDLFERARRSMQQRRNGAAKVRNGARVYALTGIAVCGRCGSPMHCAWNNVQGKANIRCYGRWSTGDCDQPTVLLQPLIDQVAEHLSRLAPHPDDIERILALRPGDNVIAAEREQILSRQKRLRKLWVEDEVDWDEYQAQKRTLDEQLQLLAPVEDDREVVRLLIERMQDMAQFLQHARTEQQNRLLRAMIEKVVVDGRAVTKVGFVPVVTRMFLTSLDTPSGDTSRHAHSFGCVPTNNGLVEVAPTVDPNKRHVGPERYKLHPDRWPEVVQYRETHTVSATAEHFGLHRRTVRQILQRSLPEGDIYCDSKSSSTVKKEVTILA